MGLPAFGISRSVLFVYNAKILPILPLWLPIKRYYQLTRMSRMFRDITRLHSQISISKASPKFETIFTPVALLSSRTTLNIASGDERDSYLRANEQYLKISTLGGKEFGTRVADAFFRS